MAQQAARVLLRHVHALAAQEGTQASDAELLRRFVVAREETAFAALVHRHGPMVLQVGRRVLHDRHAAEDVFQATFLTLARKADSIRNGAAVGCWLHGVARRLALKASTRSRKGCGRDAPPPAVAQDPLVALTARELLTALDAELAQLPEKYRAPLVLCHLEGRTHNEAAAQLGCPLGTLRSRLDRARELLRAGLERRGIALPGALLATALSASAAAAVPAALARATVAAGIQFAATGSAAGTASAGAVALTQGSLQALPLTRLKTGLAVLTVLGLLAVGGALAARQAPATAKPSAPEGLPAQPAGQGAARTVPDGDPLPAGALLRLGTTRFRHGNGIQALALSPDGKSLATAGGDEGHATVRLLDPTTGQVRHNLRLRANPAGFENGRCPLTFSPDSKALACGGLDGVVRLHDTLTGKPLAQLPPASGSVHSVAFAPDGTVLATGGDSTVRCWHLKENRELWSRPTGGSLVVFAPDRKVVAVLAVGRKDTVALLDPASGKELRQLSHGAEIIRAAFAADGKSLATVGQDRVARLWETATGKQRHAFTHTLPGPRDSITAVAFAPDGKLLVTGSSDSLIRFWDLESGKAARTLKGHTWWVTGLAFAPDGKTLYSGSWDATVRRWAVATGKEIAGPAGYAQSVHIAYSSDGSRLATAGSASAVDVWDGAGKRLRTIATGDSSTRSLALVRDGSRLATGHGDGSVRLWDASTGQLLRTLAEPVGGEGRHNIMGLAFSPAVPGVGPLRLAAAGGKSGPVHVWDLGAKPAHRRLTHPDAGALAFAPDGRTLATGGWDRKVRLWDAVTGKQLAEIEAKDIVDSLAFSPDGRLLASSHHYRPILLWDVAARRVVRELAGHELQKTPGRPAEQVVWSVAFSPDGLWLLSAGLDRTIRLWDVARGKEVLRREGHDGWVYQIAMGPRGRTALSGSLDTTALLWSLRPEGEKVAAGTTARLWDVLAGDDARAAYRAVWALVEDPKASQPLLRAQLKPARPALDAERFRRLLTDLKNPKFAQREAATRELVKVAVAIEPSLRQALKEVDSEETRRRLETVLASIPAEETPERLRERRAVAVLERMGGAQAEALLQALAAGAPSAPLTRDARAALAWSQRQGSVKVKLRG